MTHSDIRNVIEQSETKRVLHSDLLNLQRSLNTAYSCHHTLESRLEDLVGKIPDSTIETEIREALHCGSACASQLLDIREALVEILKKLKD